jgi:dihydroorotate dehydrogenase electron transfer subunit
MAEAREASKPVGVGAALAAAASAGNTVSPHFEETAVILRNDELAPNIWRMDLKAPRCAEAIQPGQFVHMLIPGYEAHILRRPFSIYQVDRPAGVIVVVYQVVGEGTRFMTTLAVGTPCSVMGALGNRWQAVPGKLLLVGGGLGAEPLFLFAQELSAAGHPFEVVLAARSRELLVTFEDFKAQLGHDPLVATDDGSAGVHGFATEPARAELARGGYAGVYCCGPEPLMRAIAQLAAEFGVPCWVSMEKRMACGVGACLSCVVETTSDKRRSCVDGPIFDASEVVWK